MDEKYLKHVEDVFGHLGVKLIASEVSGLNYAIDDDRKGIVIIGKYGKTFLSRKKAKAAADELRDMLEVFF